MKKILILCLTIGMALMFTGCESRNTQESDFIEEDILNEEVIQEEVISEEMDGDVVTPLSFDEYLKANGLEYVYPYTSKWYNAMEDYLQYIIDLQDANGYKLKIETVG